MEKNRNCNAFSVNMSLNFYFSAPYFETCQRDQPDVNECLLNSLRNLLPSLVKGKIGVCSHWMSLLVMRRLDLKSPKNYGKADIISSGKIIMTNGFFKNSLRLECIKNGHVIRDFNMI